MEDLRKELEELEHKEFMLQMIDRWSDEDYKYSWELHNKIKEIKEKLKNENIQSN